ncbi:DUF2087 domain-containing protein [Paenibacillus sp. 1P07SE]|uniref:DUF2087 domain-containing protein n=1 Tax=Paenibacillus sp. 1P07SE TaxID=3132209 RepID=UPI0039A72C5B
MDVELSERFWTVPIESLKQGYDYDPSEEAYICLVCGEAYMDGVIYPHEDQLLEASRMIRQHLAQEHGSMLHYLLSLDKKATGLTELQKELIDSFAAGLSDAEIVKRAGSGTTSTIRNHRFAMKERAKQARLYLAIMELLDEHAGGAPRFVPIHRTATQVDERYALTEAEYEAMIRKYFPDGAAGRLTGFPRKEKRKLAILRHISSRFERQRKYSEKEINTILKAVYPEDHVTLRRYLIEYGFLDRTDDCSVYWMKE